MTLLTKSTYCVERGTSLSNSITFPKEFSNKFLVGFWGAALRLCVTTHFILRSGDFLGDGLALMCFSLIMHRKELRDEYCYSSASSVT